MRNKYIPLIIMVVAVIVIGAYIVLMNPNNNTAPVVKNQDTNTQIADSGDTIKFVNQPSISFLTDSQGRTLYHTIKDYVGTDQSNASTCTRECRKTWPPFYAKKIVVSSPLKAGDFSVFTRSDGTQQIAWRGLPLYYYAGDHNIGDTNGQGIDNVWYMGILAE